MAPSTIIPKHRSRWTMGALAAVLALGGAVACGGSDPAEDKAGDANDVIAAPAPAPTGDPAVPVSAGGGSPVPTSLPALVPDDSPAPAPAPAPTIDSFDTPEDIDCHNGDFQEFTASWTTTGAEHVTISIDGPSVYAEYAPDGETSLPFNCSSSHSFLLTAHGPDGQTVSREVTLEPRNVQPDPDPEEVDDLVAP